MKNALKILTIDDNKIDSLALIKSISNSGIISDIENVFSTKAGLEKVKSTKYDLIFLDYMMPDTNGIDFLKKLKELEINTPIIFITAQGADKRANHAILDKVSKYIPKTLLTSSSVSQSSQNAVNLYESLLLCKNTEQELKINSKRLSEAQKLAKIGSWEINLNDSNDFYYSDEFYVIFEIDKKSPISIDFLKTLVNKDDLKIFKKNLNLLLTTKSEVQFIHGITSKNGTIKYIKEYLKCLKDEENKPIKISGIAQDISEQRKIELELIKAKEIAEHSVKIKEHFLANMSHEIRTPMNGIIGFTGILENTQLNEEQKVSVTSIKSAGNSLMKIIDDILDFSKIEAKMMDIESIPFSLCDTIHSIIVFLEPIAKEKKIKLLLEIDPSITDSLLGDPTRLSQILSNLLENAVKFTEKGFVEIIVSKQVETDSEITLQFSIIDTGIGIAPEKLDSIFESFNQVSNEATRKYGGTGLGLTITKKIIDLHGGSIKVNSELSKGSEFIITIQYKKINQEISSNKIIENKEVNSEFIKKLNILLVEDHELNQLLATSIFEKWGNKIDVAENGKIALEKIDKNNYDIILMDIQLPEMDGRDATRYIRKNMGPKSQVPIIALTALATSGEEKICLDAGMNDYLSKPFNPQVLLKKILNQIQNPINSKLQIDEKLVNLSYLKNFLDYDFDQINEMISLFLNKTPDTIKTIRQLNDSNDIEKIKSEVHKLKSSLGIMGITKALVAAESIENEINSESTGTKWKKEVVNLCDICEEAIEEINQNIDLIK